ERLAAHPALQRLLRQRQDLLHLAQQRAFALSQRGNDPLGPIAVDFLDVDAIDELHVWSSSDISTNLRTAVSELIEGKTFDQLMTLVDQIPNFGQWVPDIAPSPEGLNNFSRQMNKSKEEILAIGMDVILKRLMDLSRHESALNVLKMLD